jgi:hypothetical protein
VCSLVHKTISELERAILTNLFLIGVKTPIVGTPGRGICSMLLF